MANSAVKASTAQVRRFGETQRGRAHQFRRVEQAAACARADGMAATAVGRRVSKARARRGGGADAT